MAMQCRSCSSTNTRVVVTERHGYETWRYNRCEDCGAKYKTIEVYERPKTGLPPGYKAHPNQRRRGEENNLSVLTERNVLEIRRLAGEGQTYESIAKHFGIHKDSVYRIVKRKRWAHV